MSIQISRAEARHFLTQYHFQQSDLPGVFTRLGTVQYDPLNPVGRNPDLVLQARVPDYHFDDWQKTAYTDRLVYDAWDKQACLVPVSDWALRAHGRAQYPPYHDHEVLQAEAASAANILRVIREQGPTASIEFAERASYADRNSWYGLTQSKRILRALWASGLIVIHHRQHGRHYYDLPERVIPPEHYQAAEHVDEAAYHRWIIARRYQAVGLLRPNAEAAIWSACGDAATRKRSLAELLAEGALTHVQVGEKRWDYYMPSSALPLLDAEPAEPRVIFLGPLDNLVWDRKALVQLFDFDYAWEVYKPATQRRWGYYVLPVFYGDRFVARLDSRLDKGTWTIARWWWEQDVTPDATLLHALSKAVAGFLRYLGAQNVKVEGSSLDQPTREAIRCGSLHDEDSCFTCSRTSNPGRGQHPRL
jgi:hypothetical protein